VDPHYIPILQIVCLFAAMKEQTYLRYEGSLVNCVSCMLLQAGHAAASRNFIWNRHILLTAYMIK